MNNEWFFEKFALIADAPCAVERIRELVLDLATEGRIVSQLSSEGNGQTLLTEIRNNTQATDAEILLDRDLADAVRIPSSWSICALGEVAEIVRGVSFPGNVKTENPRDGYVACLRTASIQAEIDWQDLIYIPQTHVSRSDQWVLPNDIMISMANSYELVGKVAVVRSVPQKATFGAFLAAIRPILLDPYYLLYVLRSPRMQVAFRASSSQTTNIANISLGRMRPIPFPLPPLAEQKRIVAKVDELMGMCDELEAQQQERELRKSVLIRSSLSRFAESPTRENLGYLFHNSYDIPPSELRKSILRAAFEGYLTNHPYLVTSPKAIPPGWTLLDIASLCQIEDGDRGSAYPTKSDFSATGHCIFLNTKNVKRNGFDFGALEWISEAKHNQLRKGKLIRGDIVFTSRGTIGNVAHYDESVPFELMRINSGMFILRGFEQHMCAAFLSRLLRSPQIRQQIDYLQSGSAQPQLPIREFKKFTAKIPPLAEQHRIVAKVNQLMALVDELERQQANSREKASNLLDAIVHEMTSGG